MIDLILGGARSGKSRLAEQRAHASGQQVVYIATAQHLDGEMAERIQHHQSRRPHQWTTVEEPLDLVNILSKETDRPVLIDCLTIWLSNIMGAGRDLDTEMRGLLSGLGQVSVPVVMVANEVGMGIIPDNPAARAFIDAAGQLNQMAAMVADRVVLVTAGLPLALKDVEGK